MKQRVCPQAGKKSYPTQRAAISAALSYSKKRGTPLRMYRCSDCQSYHLTKRRKFGSTLDIRNGRAA